ANLVRGTSQVELAQYEQASFGAPGSPVVKAKVVAPPSLLTPANNAPVVMAGSQPVEMEFTWTAGANASGYRLRASTTPMSTSFIYDRRVASTSVRIPSFKEGTYYWTVSSIGSEKESQPSDANQFSVIRQDGQGEIPLTVEKLVQHGRVIEIIGRTEPGAMVLV